MNRLRPKCKHCNEPLNTAGQSIAALNYPELGDPYYCVKSGGTNHEERPR